MTKERILQQSLAIRTFTIDEIQSQLDNFKFDDLHTVSRFYNYSRITDYLKPYVDLTDFEYLYPVNGITEGLNYWMWLEQRQIQIADGDYQWVLGKEVGDVLYHTTPSSIDGNCKEIPITMPVVLDLAYLLSSKPQKITIPENVEKVFFSFSKCFGLRNLRIGYYWSRYPDKRLQPLIKNAKYYNYYSMMLGEHLIQNVNPEIVFNTLRPLQIQVCEELNLTPSDTIWLATSTDPMYNKFKRGNTNRLCIADLIKEKYDETIQNRQ